MMAKVRSLHFHNPQVISAIEALAEKKNCALYQAAESLILDYLKGSNATTNEVKEMTVGSLTVDMFGYDIFGYGMVLDVLIKNGYTVTLDAVNDRDMKVTFKKEMVNE